MAEHSGTHELEALLEHTAWLRSLARALLGGDGGAADDLVQDALLVALERRAPPAGNPRSWLAGVLRNLARRRRRTEGRREQRERERGLPGAEEGAGEVFARADLQRRLIEHVFALAEPYRTVLLLRYFDGLDGADIARRLGVPPSTARTRVARGLEQLRARLDAEHGGARGVWATAFAPLALSSEGVAPAATALGWEALGMGAKAKVVVGATAVVLAATVIVVRATERAPAPAAGDPGSNAAALAAAGGGPEGDDGPAPHRAAPAAGERRELAPASAGPEAGGLGVFAYGALLGTGGERIADGSLTLVDSVGRQTPASIGAPGSWSAIGLDAGSYLLVARCPGFVDGTSTLEVARGLPEVRHDVRLVPALTIPVRFLDETGAPLRSLARAGWGRALPVVVATLQPPPSALPGVEGPTAASPGLASYVDRGEFGSESVPGLAPQQDGLLRLSASPPLWVSAVLRDQVLETRRLEGPVDELVFQISPDRARGLLGGLRLRVVDAQTGEPIGRGKVSPNGMFPGGGDPIDPEGRIALLDRAPGMAQLVFHVDGYADTCRRARVLPGAVVDLGDIPLHEVAHIAGRVVDEGGEPVATSLSWFALDAAGRVQDLDPPWTSRSAGDGSFRIDCGRTRIALVLGSEWARDPLVVDASSGEGAGIELVARRGVEVNLRPGGALGARVTLATGEGLAICSTRVFSTLPISQRLAPGRHELWAGWDERVLERVPFDVPADPPGGAIAVDVPPLEFPR